MDLEYGPVILSGEEIFRPVRAMETVRDGKRLLRNEITFEDCRFSADPTFELERAVIFWVP